MSSILDIDLDYRREGSQPEAEAGKGQSLNPMTAVRSSTMHSSFTPYQGQYLAFIHYYTKVHRRPPAQRDMQLYFGVSPSAVHQMVVLLEDKKLLKRTPGKARSVDVLLPREQIPDLE